MKSYLRAFFVFIMVSGLALAGTANFGVVQVSAQAPGIIVIIGSDTTWTKADSPHNLTGPLLVMEGVTLTIEAGATVNFGYDILVNGTLVARGSSTDQIHFNGRKIEFTEYSNGWDEQTGSGCIIENAILENVDISSSVALKINNNSMQKTTIDGDSLVISNNNITGEISVGGSSVISNNIIKGTIVGDSTKILNNIITGSEPIYDQFGRILGVKPPISVSGSSVISNNTITARSSGHGIDIKSGYAYVSSNIISNASTGIMATGNATIEGNLLSDNHFGIVIQEGNLIIRNNTITNGDTGILGIAGGSATIERNLITNHFGYGINIELQAIIRNNTLTNKSSVAIRLYNCPPTSINYNNIEGYRSKSIWLEGTPKYDVDATNNWWGTTDIESINQTIYDSKYSFDLSTVTFVPFLTEPNPEAMSNPIPEFPSWTILPILAVSTLVMLGIRNKISKKWLK